MVYGVLQFFMGSFELDFVLTKAALWIPVMKSGNNFANYYRGPPLVIYTTGHDHDCFFPLPNFTVLIFVSYSVVNTICGLYIRRSVQRAK
jgi:hypothetical protein